MQKVVLAENPMTNEKWKMTYGKWLGLAPAPSS
jgi:hypothetical protein